MLTMVGQRDDDRFLDQEPIRLPIQRQPLGLVSHLPGVLDQLGVGFVAPVGPAIVKTHPQEIVRVQVIGHPAHLKNVGGLLVELVE